MAEEKDPAYSYRPPPVRVVRGRGCNESFRAAVDRSYEAPLRSTMETLNEEESESGSSFGRGGPGNSRQSSLSSTQPPMLATISTNPSTAHTDAKKPPPQKQKKGSLFKGLGSMFRFGKHRSKTPEDENRSNSKGRKTPEPAQASRIALQSRKLTHQNDSSDVVHSRSKSYELYGNSEQLNRPGSRGPIQDPTPYSHYVNYEQIQQYLRPVRHKLKLKSRQHIYQSERRRNEQAKDRPTSNYYEYESVQALINPSSTSSLPRRPNNSKGYKPAPQNSNVGGFYKPKLAPPPPGHYNHRYVVGPTSHLHYHNS